ncbi:MAG TPA: SDR family NAD(P)-dependent oxidoreductase, partial [Pirellula sp.]|nr:SDR family NAD(P)-dependent oxidoreductase [Pirellula sp.]
MNLSGHSALITGGTQGVGAAIAMSLAKAGAHLVLHGLKEDDLALATIKKCQAYGARVIPLYCDLWQPIDLVLQKIGRRSTE